MNGASSLHWEIVAGEAGVVFAAADKAMAPDHAACKLIAAR